MKTRWWYRVQGGTNLITSLAAAVFLLQVVAARSRYLPVDEKHVIEFLNFFDPDTWIRIILCQVSTFYDPVVPASPFLFLLRSCSPLCWERNKEYMGEPCQILQLT